MGGGAPSTQPSSSVCPGCAKPVDALRAGHVAIYDGVFLYYCNATCKALHLRVIASHLGDDVPTLDPPAVAERLFSHAAEKSSGNGRNGSSAGNGAHMSPAPTPVVPTPPPVVAPPTPPPPASAAGPPTEPVPSTPEAPHTLRSPVSTLPPSPPLDEPGALGPVASGTERARSAAAISGGIAGILVPLLVIADVGLGARLSFAVLAAVCLVARIALTPRDPADASPLLIATPVVGAVAAAIATYLADDPHAASIAVFAGLSASTGIAVEELISRARSEVDSTRRRIALALDVPSYVLRGEGPSELLRDVKPGETVHVQAGDMVGVDGVVSKGTALVVPWYEASIELEKVEGDAIVAGARVLSGSLRILTAWAGADRAWLRATSSLSARADVSAPTARLSRLLFERAAPAAALVAGLAAMASGGAAGWIEASVAACAALLASGGRGVVAAVALLHARAQMRALAHGIVYKDAKAFDAAGRTATAVTCSRGTVLTGEPEIVALEEVAGSGMSESRILALAAGAETASTHPLANAILRAARTRAVVPENVRSAAVHSGLGVTALASSGDRLVVGSRALLLQEQVSAAVAEPRAAELEAQGRSVLLVALAGKVVGLLALQDGLRAGARAAVQRLLDARIEPVLLSGESRETCETIARALEIDHVRPEVLPSDRGAEVRALAEGGHVVAVIGHPASDDAALGAADVAVAMGAPRAPGEWGIWLASDDVRDAALALSMAHAVRDRSRAVLAVGIVPGAVALLALAFGIGPLACAPLALAAGAGSSLAMALKDW
jgi:P-type Cu+ transporter